ncbi:hypothetical protein SNEBB_004971 [Seison nebaliae]|nr:hypothetical protein SNEBB_004971 [Seison nebaliae]
MHFIILFCSIVFVSSTNHIKEYDIIDDVVTVSGISSGGAMAIQMLVAYSKHVKGLGLISAPPFYCAQLSVTKALKDCMTDPSNIDIEYLRKRTKDFEGVGYIDKLNNLENARLFFAHGVNDHVIEHNVTVKAEKFFHPFLNDAHKQIKTKYDLLSNHGFVTKTFGGKCEDLQRNFMNKCDYDFGYEMMNHLYNHSILQPNRYQDNGFIKENMEKVSIMEFFYFSTPYTYSMDSTAYMYIPSNCKNKKAKCRFHISFHGCEQGHEYVKDDFIYYNGLNEVAELNNIVILYPQISKNAFTNPYGCWDWWGYTGMWYPHQRGFQMTALKRMMQRVINW